MSPIRSPLGAIGALLVALEAVLAGSLFVLPAYSPQSWVVVVTMVTVFVAVASVVLWMVVYLTVKKPGFLFSPAEVAQLSESAQQEMYSIPYSRFSLETSGSSPADRGAGSEGMEIQDSDDLAEPRK